ncbi:MAG: transglutaminase-like domain-containing protein [Anaerolineales bacterium]
MCFWLFALLSACQPGDGGIAPPDDVPTPQALTQSAVLQLETYSAASIVETVDYYVREQLSLSNEGPGEPSKQNLWVALIGDVYPYQKVSKLTITPDNYRIFTDEYGNQIAEFDFSHMPAGSQIQVKIEYRVSVNRLAYDLSDCVGELLDRFTQPELHIESNNPQIVALAEQLSDGKHTTCEQVRAFYDYIGENLVYSYNGNNWGAQAALGEMGSDCTEYASLMIALSRAAGIPARYMEGILSPGETSEALARTEHAWLEVYLPGAGWTPMDPTLGRSSIFREQYFAAYEPDHIIVSRGRHPSALRGASYYSHLYWPGNSTAIKVQDFGWSITPNE